MGLMLKLIFNGVILSPPTDPAFRSLQYLCQLLTIVLRAGVLLLRITAARWRPEMLRGSPEDSGASPWLAKMPAGVARQAERHGAGPLLPPRPRGPPLAPRDACPRSASEYEGFWAIGIPLFVSMTQASLECFGGSGFGYDKRWPEPEGNH